MINSDLDEQDELFAGRLIEGPGRIEQLAKFLRSRSVRKIMIVHGRNSYTDSGAAQFFGSLHQHFDCVEFTEYTPNPYIEEAMAGASLFKTENCEAILAVGGGSTLDIAKLISVFEAHQGQEHELSTGRVKPYNQLVPLIAVPTTSGSGSEATHFAVVYVNQEKYSLAHPKLLPDRIILDASLTKTLTGGAYWTPVFDAICQAIESYWSVGATDLSQSYSKKAIEHAWPILTKTDKPDANDRHLLMLASHYAGRAINVTKTTAPHALSYALTTDYGIPHGNAVALFLGSFFEFNVSLANSSRANPVPSDIILRRIDELLKLLGGIPLDEFANRWEHIMKERQLIYSFSDVGITSDDEIDMLLNKVNLERLGNHPVQLSHSDLRQHLKRICRVDQ